MPSDFPYGVGEIYAAKRSVWSDVFRLWPLAIVALAIGLFVKVYAIPAAGKVHVEVRR